MAEAHDPANQEPDWRRILDAVNDCVWSAELETDGLWRYRYVSPAIERIAGRPPDFFAAGRARWLEVIHADDRPRVAASDETLPHSQRDARTAEYRYRIIRPDGSIRWIRDSMRVTPGQPIRLDGVLTDVTAHQHAELALRASEGQLRRIVDVNPDAVLLVGPDRKITLANPAAARLFNRRRSALFGMAWDQLGIDEQSLDTGKSVLRGQQYVINRPDGTQARVLMTIASITGADAEFAGFVATFDDVTALAAATDQLARSEAQARVLLEQMPAIVWSVDRDLHITSSQGEALKGINLKPGETVGMTLYEYLQTSEAMHPAIHGCMKALDGESAYFETDHLGRAFATYLAPMRDERGQVNGAIAVSLDITRTRELEVRLRAAGRLDALGQLAGGAAHDINNLLTVLIGHLSRTADLLPADHDGRESLSVSIHAVERAAEIARQMLGVARDRDSLAGPIDLNAIVKEVLGLLGPAFDRTIHVAAEFGAGLLFVAARPGQIHQILINLCVNARDAMPLGGRLTVATAARSAGSVIRLTVADTGIGMAPEVKARIFEPLFTTKAAGRGTGLGLASVRGIVEELGGKISCDSRLGSGSRFIVDLPVAKASAEKVAATNPSFHHGTETILLADDDELIRGVAKDGLENAGYSVIEAPDGITALALARSHQPPPALAILDLSMPQLGGQATFAQLRVLIPGLRVLFSSGQPAPPGDGEYLSKPYRLVDLLIAVRRQLDARAIS